MGSENNNNSIVNTCHTSSKCVDRQINNNENNEFIGGSSETDERQFETCSPQILTKFKLYETRANFYMVGRDKSKKFWRILKIDRSEPSNIDVFEDPTVYSFHECSTILRRIDEGNKHIGGLKFVTMCYGIVGFIKFLGPYYLLLITERKKVGIICGHAIYTVSKSKMIAILPPMQSNTNNSKNENRSFVHSACKCKMYLILVKDTQSTCVSRLRSYLLWSSFLWFCSFSDENFPTPIVSIIIVIIIMIIIAVQVRPLLIWLVFCAMWACLFMV